MNAMSLQRPIGGPVATLPLPPSLLRVATVGAAVVIGALMAIDFKFGLIAFLALIYVPVVLLNLPLGVSMWIPLVFVEAIPGVNLASLALIILFVVAWVGLLPIRYASTAALLRRNSGLIWTMALLTAWTTASLVWAQDIGEASADLLNWYIAVLVFAVVASTITRPKHLVAVIIAITFGAMLSAVAGYLPGGEASATAQQDGRLAGGLGDPNYLAAGIVPALALATALAVNTRRPGLRWALFGTIGFLGISLVATGSRGGVVAAAISIAAAVAISRGRRLRIGAITVAAIATLGLFFATTSPGTWDRIREFDGEGTGRVELWDVAFRMASDHPVNGVGVNNFRTESINYVRQPGQLESVDLISEEPHVVHNIYLQQLAELGVVGLLLLLSVFAMVLRTTWKAVRRLEANEALGLVALGRAVLIAQIGALSASVFISNGYDKVLWVLLALAPVMGTLAARSDRASGEAPA